jgi:hypothetical protein
VASQHREARALGLFERRHEADSQVLWPCKAFPSTSSLGPLGPLGPRVRGAASDLGLKLE